MYELPLSKISRRYVLRELHLARTRAWFRPRNFFFPPSFLIYLHSSIFFSPRSVVLLSLPSVTRSYCISFRLSSSPRFFLPLDQHTESLAFLSSMNLLTTNHFPRIHQCPFPVLPPFPVLSPSIPATHLYFRSFAISPRYARADGPMGFRKAFATVSSSILRLVQDTVSRACTLTSPSHSTSSLFVLLLCIRRTRAILATSIKVKNDRATDSIFGFSVPRRAVLPVSPPSCHIHGPVEYPWPAAHRYLYAQTIPLLMPVRSGQLLPASTLLPRIHFLARLKPVLKEPAVSSIFVDAA